MKKNKHKKNTPQKNTNTKRVTGTISVHPRGFGFVVPDDPEHADVFVPRRHLRGAVSQDRVEVNVNAEDAKGFSGEVTQILERGLTEITGTFQIAKSGDYGIRPMRRELPEFIPLVGTDENEKRLDELPEDEWILAHLHHPERTGEELVAEFLDVISEGKGIEDDLNAVMTEFNLLPPYDTEANRRAADTQPVEIKRETVENHFTVTIDPVDAKDFDDAISIRLDTANHDTAEIGVHIVDLAAYIQPGSELDKLAAERGFTSYLPGKTLHMLPPALAAHRCSLIEGQEKLAHSVFFKIDRETGVIQESRRCHTRLVVDRRLSFDQAQACIENQPEEELDTTSIKAVQAIWKIAEKMRARRAKTEQFLAIETPEIRIVCDEPPRRIEGMKKVVPCEAHHLVEEFMLAANVAVAMELNQRDIPALYRTHGEPMKSDIEEFRQALADLPGIKTPRLDSRQAMNQFLIKHQTGRALDEVVVGLFLRTMQRAAYSAKCEPHFGLGKTHYSHFTSPIRRYPDLFIHQQLFALDTGKTPHSKDECATVAARCTALEENNDEAYYAALDRLKIRYAARLRLDEGAENYEAVVTKLTEDGLLVYIPELGLFGRVQRKDLGQSELHHGAKGRRMSSRKAGKTFKAGHVLYVKIKQTDTTRGTIDFKLSG